MVDDTHTQVIQSLMSVTASSHLRQLITTARRVSEKLFVVSFDGMPIAMTKPDSYFFYAVGRVGARNPRYSCRRRDATDAEILSVSACLEIARIRKMVNNSDDVYEFLGANREWRH